jgi:hypothetical protein
LALWTCGSFDCNRRTAGMLRLRCRHDASLKRAGARTPCHRWMPRMSR